MALPRPTPLRILCLALLALGPGLALAGGPEASAAPQGRESQRPSTRQRKAERRREGDGRRTRSPSRRPGTAVDNPNNTGNLLLPLPELLDEMDEAEREAAEQAAAAEPELETVLPEYHLASDAELSSWFKTTDYDQNGWISFGEAEAAMAFDRARFRIYDRDRDGRFTVPEYKLFYFECMRRQGSFNAPRPKPAPSAPPPRDAEQLRNAYDTDLDQQLSEFELSAVMADYHRADLGPTQVLAANDLDGDGRLSLSELDGLVALLYPVTDDQPLRLRADPAGSLVDLFRHVISRDSKRTGTPSPPMITGPVVLFSRLDLDNNGAISLEDLRMLLRPAPETVRLSSVLNSLDLDGDGVINPDEFQRAFERLDDEYER